MQPLLSEQLGDLGAAVPTVVMMHGTDIATARSAVRASGMRLITTYDKIGVAVASGTSAQIAAAGNSPVSPTSRATPRSSSRSTPPTPPRAARRR